ncbi:hypothetical protein K438DRAFT_1762902 [Mycena galopus ATCC 62051]|nr:hypothetical protein K438DRAFT_1762902 [Mycena galopus ATCC 62051]
MAKFALTRTHVDTIFDAMSRNDVNTFFAAVDPDVRWVIGSETKDPVRKTGVYNVASWVAEVATELRSRFVDGAIKMTIVSVDIVGNKAIAELRSEAVQKNGKPYCNRYVWILIFSEDTGKIVEIREYLDTAHVQESLQRTISCCSWGTLSWEEEVRFHGVENFSGNSMPGNRPQ